MAKRRSPLKRFLKVVVFCLCVVGFLYQTHGFLMLYLDFPTIVNIEISVLPEIDMPAISVCNSNGVQPIALCPLGNYCYSERVIKMSLPQIVCASFLNYCFNNKINKGFKLIMFNKFIDETCINQTIIEKIRVPLEDYFQCKIVGSGKARNCNTQNVVVGSFYNKDRVPGFCFTFYSHWGNPDAPVEKIKRSEKIVIEAFIDYSYKNKSAPLDLVQLPKISGITTPSLQLAIHSRYLMVSPYLLGTSFIGGKQYTIKVNKFEKHLLSSPYQTNCTDYMKEWRAKGGTTPLNQLMVVEECKMKAYLEEFDCVPIFVDYPHNKTVCRSLRITKPPYTDGDYTSSHSGNLICYPNGTENVQKIKDIEEKCSPLINMYSQPCESFDYAMDVEEELVDNEKIIAHLLTNDTSTIVVKTKGYNCTLDKVYTRRCQTINIVLDFEEFKIENITYNPKYETLELLSVIGGYMGIYLGISIVAIYSFAEIIAGKLYSSHKRRRRRRINSERLTGGRKKQEKMVKIFILRQSGVERDLSEHLHERSTSQQKVISETLLVSKEKTEKKN
ncbi:hypothetical protein JTE90_015282 [Oedothorax gibbosus]|uniref:Uncharacterized protein n=1 Tax=Oedothorax gibbosus TaxID=931172 RepID=A0AAV6UDQ0_9ARAC|nr:hypothetical protein JTE90_015282 [Oedothorax gibbosus]